MTKIWFKPKTYGFGATPASWEGWAATAVCVGLVAAATVVTPRYIADPQQARLVTASAVVVLVGALGWLCAVRGEGAWRWRWGKDD